MSTRSVTVARRFPTPLVRVRILVRAFLLRMSLSSPFLRKSCAPNEYVYIFDSPLWRKPLRVPALDLCLLKVLVERE